MIWLQIAVDFVLILCVICLAWGSREQSRSIAKLAEWIEALHTLEHRRGR